MKIFINELNSYEQNYFENRVDSKNPIMQFWQEKSKTFPALFQVAIVALGAAGTQVSVERLFSFLKFILNDQRDKLTSQNLDNILLVMCNFLHLDDDFFRKVAL